MGIIVSMNTVGNSLLVLGVVQLGGVFLANRIRSNDSRKTCLRRLGIPIAGGRFCVFVAAVSNRPNKFAPRVNSTPCIDRTDFDCSLATTQSTRVPRLVDVGQRAQGAGVLRYNRQCAFTTRPNRAECGQPRGSPLSCTGKASARRYPVTRRSACWEYLRHMPCRGSWKTSFSRKFTLLLHRFRSSMAACKRSLNARPASRCVKSGEPEVWRLTLSSSANG